MVLSKLAEGGAAWLRSPEGRRVAIAVAGALAAAKVAHSVLGKGSAGKKKRDEKKKKRDAPEVMLRHGRGQVDRRFFRRLRHLLSIAVPGVMSKEALYLAVLAGFLVVRTFLSIRISEVNGSIVKAIVERRFYVFLRRLAVLASIAIPASTVNSMLKFLGNKLALSFRKRLVAHFHNRYLQPMMYYKVLNLDSRISNPDQALTETIDLWGKSLSELYSNVTKPMLDIILFSLKLAELVGVQGPLSVIMYYFVSGVVIRFISPPFGKLTAEAQRREGEFRYVHNRLIMHSEEIAFYGGHNREKSIINAKFQRICEHMNNLFYKHLFMGVFDGFLVKYGAVMLGYAVLGLPVFGPGSEEYLARVSDDSSQIMEDYIRNSSLLINLAKAIGRIVTSYKDLQRLAGYTSLVSQLDDVLGDLEKGRYQRKFVEGEEALPEAYKPGAGVVKRDCDVIKFDRVPIVTPNGDLLVDNLSFEVGRGMNVFIAGPNGSGKSSLFRILGELWPSFGGNLEKPDWNQLFYIPQKPYLMVGTLRDQVIYPQTQADMFVNGTTDEDVRELLEMVHLGYLCEREGGLDAEADWSDVLSGGEKQRVAFARLLAHKPKFAILDECTSAVSVDVERFLYTRAKDMGIAIITVSHRPSLWKYHEWKLELDGRGGFTFGRMILPENFDDTP